MENNNEELNSMFSFSSGDSTSDMDDLSDILGLPSEQPPSVDASAKINNANTQEQPVVENDINKDIPMENPEEESVQKKSVQEEQTEIFNQEEYQKTNNNEQFTDEIKKNEDSIAESISDFDELPYNDLPAKPQEKRIEVKDLGVTVADEEDEINDKQEELVTVRPVKFREFEDVPPNRKIKKNYDIMQDISMHVSVELGRTKSTIKEVMDLTQGSIIELNKIAGEQVEIYVNGKIVAKGEVIVIEDRFGVRVTSTNLQTGKSNL